MNKIKILAAGKYETGYNRTKIILDGLKNIASIELDEFPYSNRLTVNYFKLRRLCKDADVIFVPAFCHQDVPIIKALTNKPVVFDPLISRYLSKVFDYKLVKTNSFRARKNFYKDKISMSKADIVLCDTKAHQEYYRETFNIPEKKLKVVEVGVNTDEFKKVGVSAETKKEHFIVGFYGSFVPLQGVKKIIEAADILKDDTSIKFKIIGTGFEYESLYDYAVNQLSLKNIEFSGWVHYKNLADEMKDFDIALGIFGDSLKADLVIPNKIFHYAAMGLPVVTRKSKAITEIFSDNENICLTENNTASIADAIIKLKNDKNKRELIAMAGHKLILENYNHKIIAQKVYEACREAISIRNQ